MPTYTCLDCLGSVPAGAAVLRSISLRRQVAFCRDCWEQQHHGVVPAPRRSPEDAWQPTVVEA